LKDFDWDKLLGREYKPPLIPKGEVYCDDAEQGGGKGADDDEGDDQGGALDKFYEWEKDF